MRRTSFIAALVCLGSLLTIISCEKKTTSTPVYDLSQINAYFAALRTAPQTFTVQAGRDTTLIGADSTILHFYVNSFSSITGIISSGTVSIQLVEMYKPGDMIRNRATTTTFDWRLLQSGGQVSIAATMNGQEVYANKYGLAFKQPGGSSQNMSLFFGGAIGINSLDQTDSTRIWGLADTTQIGVATVGTQSIKFGGQNYFVFDSCTSFDWINCDRFYDSAHVTSISVTMPDNSFSPSNTEIFLVFPAINSVCSISAIGNSYTPATNTFKLTHGQAPIGMRYELVVIANKNGSYYYYQASGVITANMAISAPLALETIEDIKARLAGL